MLHGRLVLSTPALALLLVGACATPPGEEPVAEREDPIVGGWLDHDDPAVVGLYFQEGDSAWICTGSLISRKVVLTAAHCLDNLPSVPSVGYVYFGSNLMKIAGETDNDFIAYRHAAYVEQHYAWDPNDLYAGNDVGLILMNQSAPEEVTTLAINRQSIGWSQVGDSMRLVGFGDTYGDAGDAGLKRETTTSLSDYGVLLEYGSSDRNTCQGDSGGPNFMDLGSGEVIVSVTSWGYEGCAGTSYGTNVYNHRSWIDAWVDEHDLPATCDQDNECASGCSAPDPDCLCEGDGFCTDRCRDPGSDPDCPAECAGNDYCATSCPYDPDCDACAADDWCMAGCPSDPDCGAVSPCPVDGVCDDCVIHDPDCEAGAVGSPCASADDCASNWCLTAPDDSRLLYCIDGCDPSASSCPDGMSCTETSEGYLCIYDQPTPGALGSSCTRNERCASLMCVGVCVEFCGAGDSCPSGFACTSAAGGEKLCVAAGGGDSDVDGGCTVGRRRSAASPRGAAALALITLAAMLAGRRRRASR